MDVDPEPQPPKKKSRKEIPSNKTPQQTAPNWGDVCPNCFNGEFCSPELVRGEKARGSRKIHGKAAQAFAGFNPDGTEKPTL